LFRGEKAPALDPRHGPPYKPCQRLVAPSERQGRRLGALRRFGFRYLDRLEVSSYFLGVIEARAAASIFKIGRMEKSVKIFHVIYVLGKVTAVSLVGVVSEDNKALCDRMDASSAEFLDEQFQKVAADDPHMRIDGKQLTRADFATKCVASEEAPAPDRTLAANAKEQ
jgi:hypothetical protein